MNRFERLIKIHRLLDSPRPVPVERFRTELECSRATLFRDFEYLRDFLGAPIICTRHEDGHYGHHYDPYEPRFELPGLWLNASELHGLLATEQLLEAIQPGLLKPYIGPLKTRIRQLLGQSGIDAEALGQRIQIRQIAHRNTESDAFGRIAEAVLRRRQLRFEYRSRSQDENRPRHTDPQRLIHYRNNWYLAANCHQAGGLRLFSLDRIRNPEIQTQTARDLPEKQLDRQLEGNFGIFTGPAEHWAVLRFTSEAARWAAEQTWHPDQIGQWKDGEYELQVPYGEPTELTREILAWGPDVWVVAPSRLRNAIKRQHELAAAQYRKNPDDLQDCSCNQ
ncbi:helix-turn-helix transcriptional regulator [Natronospira bacteriovora]|uniref:WYL domain-containing protein n=1 Tax=Natronospira bacteriovora TaxID=3069753 RepID=A0ABU0W7E3_9GAMM|nr:WYL domain-containing protein [Natronospira sp. AB-CW4]MDQ2069385.1 WYL domain-containing protein [Natronospira sp. AB-CW4]